MAVLEQVIQRETSDHPPASEKISWHLAGQERIMQDYTERNQMGQGPLHGEGLGRCRNCPVFPVCLVERKNAPFFFFFFANWLRW